MVATMSINRCIYSKKTKCMKMCLFLNRMFRQTFSNLFVIRYMSSNSIHELQFDTWAPIRFMSSINFKTNPRHFSILNCHSKDPNIPNVEVVNSLPLETGFQGYTYIKIGFVSVKDFYDDYMTLVQVYFSPGLL